MTQKERAPIGSQEKPESSHMDVNTTARNSDGLIKTCFCTTEVQGCLSTYSDASALSWGDLWSLYLADSPGSLETISGTVTVIDLLTIIQDSKFGEHFFNIQVKTTLCYWKISDLVIKKHEH